MMPLKTSLLFFLLTIGFHPIVFSRSNLIPILYTKGIITISNTGEVIKQGNEISTSSKLKFDSDTAFLLTIISEQVIKLTQNNYSEGKLNLSSEFSCTQLISSTSALDSIFPLQSIAPNDSLLLFKPVHGYNLNKRDFQFKNHNFLIIQFEANKKVVTKKISFSNENLIFDKPLHFRNDTTILQPRIKIYQYNSEGNHYREINSYQLRPMPLYQIQPLLYSIEKILMQRFPNNEELRKKLLQQSMMEITGVCPKRYIILQTK